LEVRPVQLHFSGFRIHHEHVQKLRVLNISPNALRLSIVAPSTQWFKVKFHKKGLLAPGMSEDLEVLFYPTDWHYYYDSISIYCGELGENLTVPLHAYPSAEIKLPHIIDFGTISIGTSRTKVIPLTCNIPVQFEFAITILKSHPDFEVIPRFGEIPADGTTNVAVTFLPSRHMTAHMDLEFSMSSLDFQPVRIRVVGSSHPDLSHKEVLNAGVQDVDNERERKKQQELIDRVQVLHEKQGRAPLKLRLPVDPQPEEIRVIDGIQIPLRNDHSATQFILGQTPGKLPLKDLFSFIKEQREAAEARRKKARTMAENDDEDDDLQARELRFEMGYREIEMFDKQKEIKSMVCLGEAPISEQGKDAIEKGREERFERLLDQTFDLNEQRMQSRLSKDSVMMPNSPKLALNPLWDEYSNNMFQMRLQVIDRFVCAGSKILLQVRARRRIAKLKEAMRAAGVTNRKTCKAWIDAESKATRTIGANAGNEVPIVHISSKFLLPVAFPSTRPPMGEADRDPVDVDLVDTFEAFEARSTKERRDYEVLGYKEFDVPAAAYMRPNAGRRGELRGCVEECSVRGPRGNWEDGAEVPLEMPQSCLLTEAHDPIALIVPSVACRTYIRPPHFTECHSEYRLKEVPPLRQLPLDTLSVPGISATPWRWLYIFRRMRTLPDLAARFDPCLASTLLGGSGFTLGHDLSGERLPFLPPMGASRDIPSDTDSDGRDEDFSLPAPSLETFMQDFTEGAPEEAPVPKNEGHLVSELHTKAKWMDERMHEKHAENNCAMRNRLEELNQRLPPDLKFYLG
jgi:hypothetical protein